MLKKLDYFVIIITNKNLRGQCNMIPFAENIGINILSNIVYDIVKNIASKLQFKKTPEKQIQSTVKTIFEIHPREDFKNLLESGVFSQYFNSPQFLDIINAYLEHKVICDFANPDAKIKRYIKKAGIISPRDIIDYISSNIYQMYLENKAISIPEISEIKKAVLFTLTAAEQTISQTLTRENSRLAYLINSRLDSHYQSIIEMLQKIQAAISVTQEIAVIPSYENHEEIKNDYHKILKEKNSSAHIYLLDKFPFESFYVPPILLRQGVDNYSPYFDYEMSLTSWNDIFMRDNIVYITGGAGYGKSLFTKKIINNYKELNIFHSEEYLVIYGELKSFYPNGVNAPISVVEFLRSSIRSSTLVDVSREFVEFYLNSGRCIILLDALDEVEKSKRNELHENIIAYFRSQNPNNKICITSRDRGFIPEENVEVLKICPLNNEQIEKYVDKIIALGKFERNDKDNFMSQTQLLVEKGFLNSFLVLSLLINIYKAERELPENKLDLYQKCFEYISKKREMEKTALSFDWSIISPIMKDNTFIELARLCMPNNSNVDKLDIKNRLVSIYKAKYGCEVDADNAVEEFLKFCSDRTELFVPTVEDKYKFFHRSFFEYFYSFYIFLRCENAETMLAELVKFDVDSEVFELTTAMLKQKDEVKYQALIDLLFEKAIVELNNTTDEYIAFNILILSMQVVDDVLYKNKLLDLLVNYKDTILKNISRIRNMRVLEGIYKDDQKAYETICNSYHSESMEVVLSNFDNVAYFFDEFQDNQEALSKTLHSKDFSRMIRRRFAIWQVEYDKHFYFKIFTRLYDIKQLLNTIHKDVVLSLYKKFSPRNYKKRTEHFFDTLNKVNAMPSEDQDVIWELIASNDFIMHYRGIK